MPVMSRIERAFCCGVLWRYSTAAVTRSLPAHRLGTEVLEIGAGSGMVAAEVARARPEVSITATDLDPAMVDAARRRLGSAANVTVGLADATELPFAEQTFDSVLSCLMLHHVLEWQQCLAEAARVLRPGGWLLGYDLTRTRLASVVHRLDRSPFRLINPDELDREGGRHGLQVETSTRFADHVVQFAAQKLSAP